MRAAVAEREKHPETNRGERKKGEQSQIDGSDTDRERKKISRRQIQMATLRTDLRISHVKCEFLTAH